jgi:Fur family ferric uptake transcriptional regulator
MAEASIREGRGLLPAIKEREGHGCAPFWIVCMLSEESIVEQLSEAGYRITQPRKAVIRALLEDEGHPSPADVHARARLYCSTVGLVTVYRTLDLLSEMGFVRRIHTNNGCHSYASASQGHCHHMICRVCGAAVEFEGCDLSAFLARLSHDTGFTIEGHLLELVGVCAECR